jgi:hypothetical protein
MVRALRWSRAMPDEVVDWVLSQGDRRITCSMREMNGGARLAMVHYDGLPVIIRQCAGPDDWVEWSRRIREEWRGHGWQWVETSEITEP